MIKCFLYNIVVCSQDRNTSKGENLLICKLSLSSNTKKKKKKKKDK